MFIEVLKTKSFYCIDIVAIKNVGSGVSCPNSDPAAAVTCFMLLTKFLKFFMPQFFSLYNGDSNSTYLREL